MVTICCPKCGEKFDAETISVLTKDSPHMPELLEGTLNRVKCPTCGAVLHVPCRLIFRDAEHPFMLVQERRPANAQALRELVSNVEAAATQAAMEQGMERPQLRMVFDRPEFIEKIFIHQRGFDDRVMEYAKYQLLTGTEGLEASKHRLHYDFSHRDEDIINFIVFSRKSHRPVRMLQVPMEEYQALSRELLESSEALHELERAFPDCIVDVDRFFDGREGEEEKEGL